MKTLSTYEQQALETAQKLGLKLTILGSEFKNHFAEDKECRLVFKCRLSRSRSSYTFAFGQSIISGSQEPTMYDVLTCMQKYEVGSFEDFCNEFGYNEDSRAAERTYKAVCKEFAAMERMFTSEELEILQEIQ